MRLFKVFPNLGNNYNFTEARNRTVKQNKGKHESAAFSLRNQNNVCKVKLRQFKERTNSYITERSSSEQEHKANALASGADEGRDKLR